MKIDRLLGIILFLLNRERASAKTLAEAFGVTPRTIQRDMVCLSQAGIPVYAEAGQKGGYAILEQYKVKNHVLREEDLQLILKALESLATSYSGQNLNEVIEKYASLVKKDPTQGIFWDFSVTRENAAVQENNRLLEEAVRERRILAFHYRNAEGRESEQRAEPLAIHYKWYAWYVFAWNGREYRTYKVARMSELLPTGEISRTAHGDVKALMRDSEQRYYATCSAIEVWCAPTDKALLEEYFPDCPLTLLPNGKYQCLLHVPERERLWQALLLSFGGSVQVVSPAGYRDRLIQTAKSFLSNYDS